MLYIDDINSAEVAVFKKYFLSFQFLNRILLIPVEGPVGFYLTTDVRQIGRSTLDNVVTPASTRWGYLQPGRREYLTLRHLERFCE